MANEFKPICGLLQYPYMDYFLMDNPDMDIKKVIAENLNNWMEGHPRFSTIKPLAVASGVSFGTIQRVKKGEVNLTVEKVEAIAHAFRRDAIDLMKDSATHYAQRQPVSLHVAENTTEPPSDEREILQGYRSATPEVRELMLDAARRAIQKQNFSARSETQ